MKTERYKPIPPKEHNDIDLLELVCQLHSRALAYPSKKMHDAYMEARNEMESRLKDKELYAESKCIEQRKACSDSGLYEAQVQSILSTPLVIQINKS